MQGPSLNTLQNEGVHGWPSSTLQGACANGVASIWRRDWASAGPIPANRAIRQTIKHRSMRQSLGYGPTNLMSGLVGIKAGRVQLPAFGAALPRLSSSGLTGRSSIPETVVIHREAAAYWVPRFRGGRQRALTPS